MCVVASLVLLVTLVACATSPALKNQRVEFWERKLKQDLHVGMPKSEIQAWAAATLLSGCLAVPSRPATPGQTPSSAHECAPRSMTEQYSKGKPRLVIAVEDVPGSFSLLTGCKGWHIYIFIFLDESHRMTSDVVRADSICL